MSANRSETYHRVFFPGLLDYYIKESQLLTEKPKEPFYEVRLYTVIGKARFVTERYLKSDISHAELMRTLKSR